MAENRSCKKDQFDEAEDDEELEEMKTWYDYLLDHGDSCDPYLFSDNIPWWHTIQCHKKT